MGSRELSDARPLIGDEWVVSTSAGSIDHVDPATGRANGTVHMAGVDEVDAAIVAAQQAFPAWRDLPGDQRRRLLLRLEELIEGDAELLGRTTSLELGHPLTMTRVIAELCAGWFGYYAGWADKIEGSTIPLTPALNSGLDYTVHEPYGVVGIIITWNGPLISVAMKVAPALAAGNCVILKTPEVAPYACARFAQLALEAGIPPGVLNVIPGGPEPGDRLVRDPRVGMISFTGGLQTARLILDAAKETIKPVVLELGGKSARLIFADADLDVAFATAMDGAFTMSGQECTLGSRILVQEQIYDEAIAHAMQALPKLRPGDPLDPATNMGPVVNQQAYDRILATIAEAERTGAGRKLVGGSPVAGDRLGADFAGGYFIEPTVFTDLDERSDLANHEVFGPVLGITKFSTEDEAVALANSTNYGLAAHLHTRDVARVHRLARRLEAGSIRVNGGQAVPPGARFGGYKQSGLGVEGGKPGLDAYMQIKNVFIRF